MNAERRSASKLRDKSFNEKSCFADRRRYPLVWNRKGHELNPLGMAKLGLLDKTKIANLVTLKEGNNHIQPRKTPPGHLVK